MRQHVVLVEDNISDVELIKTAFSEALIVIDMTVFRDGDGAIAGMQAMAIAGSLPDLVLLDLNLPSTSGHAVLVAIRMLPAFDLVPVIVLSTSNHPIDRDRCLSDGADDYQVKPSHFVALMQQVRVLHREWLTLGRSRAAAAPETSGEE